MENEFSIKERLFLMNQYDILSKLSDDDGEKKNYENMSEIFRKGYAWGYNLATETIQDEITEKECRFVLDVLNMYGRLYYSRENNNDAKESVEERKVLFKGFDLNDSQECKYFSFYQFLVNDLDRFSEFKEWMDAGKIEDFNSHGFGPSIDKLELMLEKTREMNIKRQERHDLHFKKDEIEQIINA